jgi:hypothetical protein
MFDVATMVTPLGLSISDAYGHNIGPNEQLNTNTKATVNTFTIRWLF